MCLDETQAGGDKKPLVVLAIFDHRYPFGVNFDGFTDHVINTCPEITNKPLVNHFQRWQASTNNPILIGKIINLDLGRIDIDRRIGFGLDITAIHAMEQRINFVLTENILHRSTTNLLHYELGEKDVIDINLDAIFFKHGADLFEHFLSERHAALF